MQQESTEKRKRRGIAAIIPFGFALLLSLALAGSIFTALGGFSASVTNPGSTYSSGTILLSEGSGANTCFSNGTNTTTSTSVSNTQNTTCTSISLLGSQTNADPGIASTTTTETLENVGTLPASSLTMNTTSCTAAANTATSPYSGTDTAGFCAQVNVTIGNGLSGGSAQCYYPATAVGTACPALSNSYTLATLQSFGPVSLGSLASLGSTKVVFTSQLNPTDANNGDQGLTATISTIFTLTQ